MNSWHSTIKNSLPFPFTKNQRAETYQSNCVIKSFQEVSIVIVFFSVIEELFLTLDLVVVWMEYYMLFYQWTQEFCEWMSVIDSYQSITGKIHSVKYSFQSTAWELDVWWWNNLWEVTRKLFCQNNCIALTATCCKRICAMLHEQLYVLR